MNGMAPAPARHQPGHPLTLLEGSRLVACAAIVVLYFPGRRELDHIERLIEQFGCVIVVVNGLDEAGWRALRGQAAAAASLMLLDAGANVGIAAALNLGAGAARARGYAWMATFDQDSVLPAAFASGVASAVGKVSDWSGVALFSPVHVANESARRVGYSPVAREHGAWAELRSVITSGNIVSVQAWASVAGYLDSLFIDLVDYEFCFRLRQAAFRLVLLREVTMQHDIGEPVSVRCLGRRVPLDGHSPVRFYYMFRNFLLICPRHLRCEPRFFLRTGAALALKGLMLALFHPMRGAYVRAMASGLAHGLSGRAGAAPAARKT